MTLSSGAPPPRARRSPPAATPSALVAFARSRFPVACPPAVWSFIHENNAMLYQPFISGSAVIGKRADNFSVVIPVIRNPLGSTTHQSLRSANKRSGESSTPYFFCLLVPPPRATFPPLRIACPPTSEFRRSRSPTRPLPPPRWPQAGPRRARANHHHIGLFIPLRGPGLRLRVFEAQHAQRRRARARRSRLDQIPPRKRFLFPAHFFSCTHPVHAVIGNAGRRPDHKTVRIRCQVRRRPAAAIEARNQIARTGQCHRAWQCLPFHCDGKGQPASHCLISLESGNKFSGGCGALQAHIEPFRFVCRLGGANLTRRINHQEEEHLSERQTLLRRPAEAVAATKLAGANQARFPFSVSVRAS